MERRSTLELRKQKEQMESVGFGRRWGWKDSTAGGWTPNMVREALSGGDSRGAEKVEPTHGRERALGMLGVKVSK